MASRHFLQEEAGSAFKLIYGWQLKPSQPRESAARATRVFFRYTKAGATSKRVMASLLVSNIGTVVSRVTSMRAEYRTTVESA